MASSSRGRSGSGSGSGHSIEMTTFNQPRITTRSRSGSFTGHIDDTVESRRSGYAHFSFSHSTGEFDVKTIVSGARGGGTRMMEKMEHLAREHGATSMVTATSRPGFFQKVGFDYTPSQKKINALKYTADELRAQENNHNEGGGGFMMSKDLK